MAIALTNITGATVTGLTSPTYTVSADTAPVQNAKQWAITALGGTQTGVDVHTVSKPFTVTFFRAPTLKVLPAVNPVTGVIKNIPMNTYKMIVRKGVIPYVNQAAQVARMTVLWEIPAGSETYEPEDLGALCSAGSGAITQQIDNVYTLIKTGVI